MKTIRTLPQFFVIALAFVLTLSTSFAQEEPPLAEDGQKTADKTPPNPATSPAAREMPDIAGIWDIQKPTDAVAEGRSRCEIHLIIDKTAGYECKLLDTPDKMTFFVEWMPETHDFRGTMVSPLDKTGMATIVLKPDKDTRAGPFSL